MDPRRNQTALPESTARISSAQAKREEDKNTMDAKNTHKVAVSMAQAYSDSENVIELYKALGRLTGARKTSEEDPQIDKTVYATLQQTADLLDRSLPRIRQLYWDGRFKTAIKGEKRVYITRAEIKTLKDAQVSRVVQSSTLVEERLGRRVVKSVELVTELVKVDPKLSKEEKALILQTLAVYAKAAEKYAATDK